MTLDERTGYARTTAILLAGDGVRYTSVSTRADRALALIDQERSISVPALIGFYDRDAGAVQSDPHLSDAGKRDRIKSVAVSRLENLANAAKAVVEIEAEYFAEEATALQLPPWSDSDRVEVDIALANRVFEMEARSATDQAARTFLSGFSHAASERMRLAVARLPVELSGLTKEQHDKVRHSLIPPSIAARLDGESKAIAAARKTTQAAIDFLTSEVDAEHRHLVSLFGNKWKLKGSTTPEEREARIKSLLQGVESP